MNSWKVFLANSDDLTKIADISDECRGKSLQVAVNKAGSFNFNVPMSTDRRQYLNPSEHCIILIKNDVRVWSGPIWTKEEDFTTGKIAIGAVGWFQFLHKRFITDSDHTYTSYNDGAIALNLLSIANADQDTWLNAGSNTSAATRTMVISQWQNIGEQIEALTNVESGFDFEVDPVTRNLNIYAWDDFDDNGVHFAQNWGPDNATGVVRSSNSDDQQNEVWVVGQSLYGSASDSGSISTYNLHQQVITLNEQDNAGLLGAIANAEVATNKDPRVVIQFTPKPPTEGRDYPEVFEDFNLRDKVYLSARRDGASINKLGVRVFGFTLDIDENNNERISSLQTTYQSSG